MCYVPSYNVTRKLSIDKYKTKCYSIVKGVNNMELIKIFMNRDGMTLSEAEEQVDWMKEQVAQGENPEDVLYDEGLEPDYILELL